MFRSKEQKLSEKAANLPEAQFSEYLSSLAYYRYAQQLPEVAKPAEAPVQSAQLGVGEE